MTIVAWMLARADAAAGGFSVAGPASVAQPRDPQRSGTVLATLRRPGPDPGVLALVPQGTAAVERRRSEGVRVGPATT